MKKLNKEGFTLLELLAVLVILAALATIAIPIFTNKGAESRYQAHKSNVREILGAIQRYEWDNGTPAAATATYYNILNSGGATALITGGYLSSYPTSPYASVTGKTAFAYVVGIDRVTSKTTVKLVAYSADGTTFVAPTATTAANVIGNATDSKFIAASGADGVYEIPITASTVTTDPAAVIVP